jgi:arylsulfatase A-like enzyme
MPTRILVPLLLLASATLAAPPEARRPHIVFLLADDLGVGDVGCYGGRIIPTPHLDRLAAEGIRFTQYYSASPICSPSRAGLITGMYPARWRITSFLQTRAGNRGCEQADWLDPAAPSLPRQLKAAGYATAHFGKWHLGGGRDVRDAPRFAAYGYDEHAGTWESPEPHPDITATNWIWSDEDKVKRWERTGYFVDNTLDFVKRTHAAGKPAFVSLWLDDPHTPWVPGADAPKGDRRPNLKGVLGEMDRQVGRLLDGLKEIGIEKDTLLVFASDNGALPTFRGERSGPYRGSKLSLYEGGIRLPFIARWPGRTPAGKVDDTTVLAAVDVLPTLCAIAGAELPKGATVDGLDLSDALLGQPVKADRVLFWEYGRNDEFFKYPQIESDRSPNLAMRRGKWKLLVNADGSRVELYDVVADLGETKNQVSVQSDVAHAMAEKVLAWRRSVP